MIFAYDGTLLNSCYLSNGGKAPDAYDVKGAKVYPSPLTVMSYNLQRWEGYNSLKDIQDIAFGAGADIIGIQEWGYTASKTIESTDCEVYLETFGYQTELTEDDVNHKALATKLAIEDYSETVFAASYETRSYTKCYISVNGQRVAWFNTHLDYQTDDVKYNQVSELLDAVSDEEYFILTGDLNTTCTTKSDLEYIKCVMPFVNAGYNVANSPEGQSLLMTYYNSNTVAQSTLITPPDNIITSANIEITDVRLINTKLSAGGAYVIDHLPIIATLYVR